jgi:flagellar biosynthesis anti-sigma factor FlgM
MRGWIRQRKYTRLKPDSEVNDCKSPVFLTTSPDGLKRLSGNADSCTVGTGESAMKVELNSPSATLLPAGRSVKQVSTGSTTATQGAAQDRTTFHSDSLSVTSLTSQAMSSPEIRQDKVDTLSQSVNNGTYQLDATRIAGAIVDSKSE